MLAALADPVRLVTVRALAAGGSSSCNELHGAVGLQVSRSTFSHHQRILREAGVIRERIQGAQRILTIRRDDLQTCFPGLLDAVLGTPEEYVVVGQPVVRTIPVAGGAGHHPVVPGGQVVQRAHLDHRTPARAAKRMVSSTSRNVPDGCPCTALLDEMICAGLTRR